VASVNGDVISIKEYEKAYRSLVDFYQQQYQGVWNESLVKSLGLKARALNELVERKLVEQEARRIGLDVTEQELQEKILTYPAFQLNGQFSEGRYRTLLSQYRMTAEEFEAGVAETLLTEKISQFLTTFASTTKQGVLDQYTYLNEKINIRYVQFQRDSFKDDVQIDQAAMASYFEENKGQYLIPEKIKIATIEFDPAGFESSVFVPEQQVVDYYDMNMDRYEQKKEVRARHILFKIDQGATEEEVQAVKERAESVLKEARSGKDFADLAKTYSEGPSGKDGGDLGFFSEGQMTKSFEEVAFQMKKGEISDLVRTEFGYHIIKVEDIKEARIKSFEEVRDEIRKNLVHLAASDLAHEKGLSLIDQMPYDVDLTQYAAEHGVSADETGYFSQSESLSGVAGDDRVRQILFAMDKGDVSDLIEYRDKFYIIQVVDKKSSYLPELQEVEEKLREDFRNHLAMVEAKNRGERYLKELKGGADWDNLAQENHLVTKETGFFSRREPVPELGYFPEFTEAAFMLHKKEPYPEGVLEFQDGIYVISLAGREGIDTSTYDQEKAAFFRTVETSNQQMLFGKWIKNLQEKADIQDLRPAGMR
jgi:peptidyl-prolyl cis-trans isomerase D